MTKEARSQRSAPYLGSLDARIPALKLMYPASFEIMFNAGRAQGAREQLEKERKRRAARKALIAPLEAKIDVLSAKVDTLTAALAAALAAFGAASRSSESATAPEPAAAQSAPAPVINVNVEAIAIPCERGHVEDYEADDGTILIDKTKKDPPN